MQRASTPQVLARLRANGPWLLVAAAVFAFLVASFATTFGKPDNMSAPTFGTAWAPYSDSLGPWLDGALAFLFGLQPPTYLYRPTVGIFWASILGTAGAIEAIPLLFTAWLLGVFAAMIVAAGEPRVRNAVTVGLGLCAITFASGWHSLFISSINVDLPSLAWTASGVLLLLWGRGPSAHPALLVGCACLGVAAAIRGPFMLAGLVAIAIRVLLVERTPPRIVVACATLFIAPLVIDVVLQRHLGVINNGIMAMYCFYSDPHHAWTPECNIAYLARKPTGGEVLGEYLVYLLSAEGRTRVFDSMAWRITRDLSPLYHHIALVLLAGAGAVASWTERSFIRDPLASPMLRAAAVVAGLAALRILASGPAWLALAMCAAALAVAGALRLWGTVLCLAAYLAGTLYLCLLGFHGGDRLQHTFSVCLYLSIGFFIMETARPREAAPAPRIERLARHATAAAVAAAILFLYLGNFALPNGLRDTYAAQVRGKPNVAIKLGGDPRIDRSLYYSGERHLFYTPHDALAVGAVRRYSKLANGQFANASFVAPNAFVD